MHRNDAIPDDRQLDEGACESEQSAILEPVPQPTGSGKPPSNAPPTLTASGGDASEPDSLAGIPDEKIAVGANGILSIPREEIEGDDGGEEEEPGGSPVKIRKPGRREFIILNPALELSTKLLVDKPNGSDSMDEVYYWIAPDLRKRLKDELKGVRVFPYYSTRTRGHALWLVKVSLDNPWYERLHDRLLRQAPEFFERYEVRIFADMEAGHYRVKKRLRSIPSVTWPDRSTGDLLAEALGPTRIITTPNHPLYLEIVSGEEVE